MKKEHDTAIRNATLDEVYEAMLTSDVIRGDCMRDAIRVVNSLRTLKAHGQAHMAQDLLPQFTDMCKKVEKLEGQLNFKLNDGPIFNHGKRIADLEKQQAQVNASENIERICKRLNDHDESIEALSETADQLSTCKCEAGAGMLKRIADLETYIKENQPIWDINRRFPQVVHRIEGLETAHNCQVTTNDEIFDKMAGLDGRLVFEGKANQWQNTQIANLDEANKVFLKSIPDIEILKTQMQGLVRDVDTLKIQFHNTNLHYNGLITEVLEQKKFLAKVQAILDRERDDRLVNSPSHKKELEALKMDKHVDMMVKKGRPRKP